MRRSVVVLCVLSSALSAAEPKTAQGILDAMARTYADCSSYRDQGTVTTALVSDTVSVSISTSFLTAFVRPARFRFECAGTNAAGSPFRYVLWRQGDVTQHWSSRVPGIRTDATFSAGVLAAAEASVSNRASHLVPSLLLPKEVTSWGLASMGALTMADDKVDGHDCFKIDGTFETNTRTLWIDKRSLLIRRVREDMVIDRVHTVRTVSYEPVLDTTLDDASLAPGVPEAK